MIRAAIYGGTGYGGAELCRLLSLHPDVELVQVTSREPGRRGDEVHPGLRGLTDLAFTSSDPFALLPGLDGLFFALPHGRSQEVMDEALARVPNTRIYGLARDHRIGRESEGWVYGQPEFQRAQIQAAQTSQAWPATAAVCRGGIIRVVAAMRMPSPTGRTEAGIACSRASAARGLKATPPT